MYDACAPSPNVLSFAYIAAPAPAMPSTTVFKNTLHLDDLDPGFQAAINASKACLADAKCNISAYDTKQDTVVGSTDVGQGYCNDQRYHDQSFCACVNAPEANAVCVFKPCANNALAYRNVDMHITEKNKSGACPKIMDCQQILNVGGASNVVSDIHQELNCGGSVTNVLNKIITNPLWIVIIIFVLLIILSTITKSTTTARDSTKLAAAALPTLNF